MERGGMPVAASAHTFVRSTGRTKWRRPGETLARRDLGLTDVEQTSLLIRMEYTDFDDYRAPFASGEGPHGQYVVNLPETARETLKQHVRRAYIANRPDGPRSMVAVAWACRGSVPA